MKKCIYCFLLILAACGGGGGGAPPAAAPPPPPPPPADASPGGLWFGNFTSNVSGQTLGLVGLITESGRLGLSLRSCRSFSAK